MDFHGLRFGGGITMLRKTLTTKTTPRTVFRACSCMTFEKNICYEKQKNYVKILMVLNIVLSCTIPLAGRKGTKLLFARNCNMSIFFYLGPLNVVRFLRCISFRCGIGYIFVALFVKSSLGTFVL